MLAALGAAAFALGASAQLFPPTPPPPPPASPVIARVEGRPVTQQDFDRIGGPYFERLRSELGENFNDNIQKVANHNVLNELIRRELLAIEAQRRNVPVAESETDSMLRLDPFFQTNGKFDQAKLIQFKSSPQSNYITLLPRLREACAAAKLDRTLRARFTPSAAVLRAEWLKRSQQMRFHYVSVHLRDMSLDPEASDAEQMDYYKAHPDQFERKPKVRLRYMRLPLPAAGDSIPTSESASMKRGRRLADSLRAGAPIDSLADPGDILDTGLFNVPPLVIPGLGREPELNQVLAHADSDTTIKVVGPALAMSGVIVGTVVERQARQVPPFAEVRADVKRRANVEKRRADLEAEKRAYYEAHADSFRTPSARVTRVVLDEGALVVRPPSAKEVEKWYSQHGRSLLSGPDGGLAENAALPVLTDSLRGVAAKRITSEARADRAGGALARISKGWAAGRNVRSLAKSEGAKVDTITFVRPASGDSIFPGSLVDSLFAPGGIGAIEGPRRFGPWTTLWRVEMLDSTSLPPFERVAARAEQAVLDGRRKKDEAEAEGYFTSHRTEYRTPQKFVIDYIRVRVPPADSVTVPEADLKRSYEKNLARYKQEEQVRARHILISNNPAQTPGGDARAKARADSLRRAIAGGADFAEVARRFSQDPGSGANGGELGFFVRSTMVQEFADTSFALPVGRVSQPVKTRFGYHVIEVEEKKPAGTRPFPEVQAEIRSELATSRADSLAKRTAGRLRTRIVSGAVGAQVAAAAHGGLKTTAPFAKTDPVSELGFVRDLALALETVPIGTWAPKPFRAADAYVVVRVAKRVAPAQAGFEEVKRQVVEDSKNAKRKQLLDRSVASIRSRVAAGEPLDSLAAEYGGWKDSGLLPLSSTFVPQLGAEPHLMAVAAKLKPGATTDTVTINQGTAWLKLDEKRTPEGASFARDRGAIEQEMLAKQYEDWITQKKKTVKIQILRADLRVPPPPPVFTTTVSGGR